MIVKIKSKYQIIKLQIKLFIFSSFLSSPYFTAILKLKLSCVREVSRTDGWRQCLTVLYNTTLTNFFSLPHSRIYLPHVQSLKVPITARGTILVVSSPYTHCALSEFIVVPALEQRSPSSRGVFYRVACNKVSTCKKPPRCSAIQVVEKRYGKRQRGRRARRWDENGRVARKRNRRDAVECALHQAARESNRNRVKCSRVKPCRGTTSITCGGFVTATFSATFQRATSPLLRHHRIVPESFFVREPS